MDLSADDVGQLRRCAAEQKGLPAELPTTSLSTGAAIELACTAHAWNGGRNRVAFDRFAQWSRGDAFLADTWAALNGTRPMTVEYTAVPRDVRSITDSRGQSLFANKFSSSLQKIGGYPKAFSIGLAGALGEMVDNVFQHSTPQEGVPAPAVMGFEVVHKAFCFSVGDVGRGALASLRQNPIWRHLQDDEGALDAIVSSHASRRGADVGTGFRQVVRALVELGVFRYRTGDAYAQLEVAPAAHTRNTVRGRSVPLSGVQMIVTSRKI